MNGNKNNVLTYTFAGITGMVALINWYLENKDTINDLVNKLNEKWTTEEENLRDVRESLSNTFPGLVSNQEGQNSGDPSGASESTSVVGSVSPTGPTANPGESSAGADAAGNTSPV